MTKNRKKALEWFHKHGEVCLAAWHLDRPKRAMVTRMINAGEVCEEQRGGPIYQRLTDVGRQKLHEAV